MTSPASEPGCVQRTDPDCRGVGTLQLNRPDQANALDEKTVEALHEGVHDAGEHGTRVLVLSAAGRHFCAGFDLADLERQSDADLLRRFVRVEQLLQAIWNAPYVTVACVHGAAIGAGADLVAACTHRLGHDGSRFRFPGFRFGVALGTRRLAAVVGREVARDLLLSGRTMDGAEALRVGLLTYLNAPGEFDTTVGQIAEDVAVLDDDAVSTILDRTEGSADDDGDLAALVRSTASPGLQRRMSEYVFARQRNG